MVHKKMKPEVRQEKLVRTRLPGPWPQSGGVVLIQEEKEAGFSNSPGEFALEPELRTTDEGSGRQNSGKTVGFSLQVLSPLVAGQIGEGAKFRMESLVRDVSGEAQGRHQATGCWERLLCRCSYRTIYCTSVCCVSSAGP